MRAIEFEYRPVLICYLFALMKMVDSVNVFFYLAILKTVELRTDFGRSDKDHRLYSCCCIAVELICR